MKTYDLYGFRKRDIEQSRIAIEQILKVNLEPHESLYRGGEYYHFDNGDESLTLQKNRDPFDGDWLEEKAQGHEVILYVNTVRSKEIEQLLFENGGEVTLLELLCL